MSIEWFPRDGLKVILKPGVWDFFYQRGDRSMFESRTVVIKEVAVSVHETMFRKRFNDKGKIVYIRFVRD